MNIGNCKIYNSYNIGIGNKLECQMCEDGY